MQNSPSTHLAWAQPPSLLPLPSRERMGLVWEGKGASGRDPNSGQAARVPSVSRDADRVCSLLHRHLHHLPDPLTPSVRAHASRVKMLPFPKRGRPAMLETAVTHSCASIRSQPDAAPRGRSRSSQSAHACTTSPTLWDWAHGGRVPGWFQADCFPCWSAFSVHVTRVVHHKPR